MIVEGFGKDAKMSEKLIKEDWPILGPYYLGL